MGYGLCSIESVGSRDRTIQGGVSVFRSVGTISRIRAKISSKSPVSQAVASSGTMAWHPYRS
jgi:hypothetical protein